MSQDIENSTGNRLESLQSELGIILNLALNLHKTSEDLKQGLYWLAHNLTTRLKSVIN